jgi:hypothetical protein
MTLSRIAREFAAEIALHEWSDAPYRLDRAGHQLSDDPSSSSKQVLTPEETKKVRRNAALVVAQVLAYSDPNFDLEEFLQECDDDVESWKSGLPYALRRSNDEDAIMPPGVLQD